MTHRKYNINGRDMIIIDNLGLVDYNDYSEILHNGCKRKNDILSKYESIQSGQLLENEPKINYSILYCVFLDNLKNMDPENYIIKNELYKNYLLELKNEEDKCINEICSLLLDGYSFNNELKKYGFYIININNNYYEYKSVFCGNFYNKDFDIISINDERLDEINREASSIKNEIEKSKTNKILYK